MTRNIRDEFGLACPRCGNADKLEIVIVCTAELTVNGSEDFGDHEWNGDSPCQCPDCDYAATVKNFKIAGTSQSSEVSHQSPAQDAPANERKQP